jgi:hypothetical protein
MGDRLRDVATARKFSSALGVLRDAIPAFQMTRAEQLPRLLARRCAT